MNKIFGAVLLALTSICFAISAEFYDEQQNNGSYVGLRININNNSSSILHNIKLRYYFNADKGNYKADTSYVPNASLSTHSLNDTLAYIEINMPSVPKGYFPDKNGFSIGLHHKNWSNWNRARDYSYIKTSTLTENKKIVILKDDEVIYGELPIKEDNVAIESAGKLKIVGFRPLDDAWIEIANVGDSKTSADKFEILDKDAKSSAFGKLDLNAGEKMRFASSKKACGSFEKCIVSTNFAWTSVGEAMLKRDSSVVSYVCWGAPGELAQIAVNANVWDDETDFFYTEYVDSYWDVDYVRNVFFRISPEKDGSKVNDWFSYSSNDNPDEEQVAPKPIKLTANKPVMHRIPGEKSVLFSWIPIENITSYRVVVVDGNKNVIHSVETQSSSIELEVENGMFGWEVWAAGYEPKLSELSMYEIYNLEEAEIYTNVYKVLSIESIKARKDTKMLDLLWKRYAIAHKWDQSHINEPQPDVFEQTRCWAASVEAINHYYGGDLTQDEIVFGTRFIPEEPLYSALDPKHGADVPLDDSIEYDGVIKALEFALNPEGNVKNTIVKRNKGVPAYNFVKKEIDEGRPIFAATAAHAFVIYGYIGNSFNYAYLYAYGDNNGYKLNSVYYDKHSENSKITYYYTISNVIPGNVRMSDYRIHRDSDDDGITDFDEVYRFGTNPFYYDTDGDGISDKKEIFDYTIKVTRECRVESVDGISRSKPNCDEVLKMLYSFADIDKDGLRNELDADANGNGINDGLEDDHANITINSVPEDFTFFARTNLTVNDGVSCFDSNRENNDYCSVAATGNFDFYYKPLRENVFSLGARAHVGNVNVNFNSMLENKDCVSLRSSSIIHGNVKIQTKVVENLFDNYISAQNGSEIKGTKIAGLSAAWNHAYIYDLNSIPNVTYNKKKLLQRGVSYNLKDNDAFDTLKVDGGATLFIEPGVMHIKGLLQVEAGAKIVFTNPGQKTELHLDGNLIWHVYDNEPLSNTNYWSSVAKGFILYQHSSIGMNIEGAWGGTIFAPLSDLILGQATKTLYGRFLAKNITVHQYSKVFRVDYKPDNTQVVAYSIDFI